MIDNNNPNPDSLAVSYLYLRKVVGILGIAFPPVLVVGSFLFGACTGFQDSISDYHNTNMRDVFVGLLSAIALFLFAYSGYDKLDFWMAKLVGVLGFMVAIFPDGLDDNECTIYVKQNIPEWIETVHFISAASFFLILAYFSIFLFTKSKKDNEDPKLKNKSVAVLAVNSVTTFFKKDKTKEVISPEKARRNKIYRRCGYVMLLCLLLLVVYFISEYLQSKLAFICPVLILETIALWAFGTSWLIKGQFLLKDK